MDIQHYELNLESNMEILKILYDNKMYAIGGVLGNFYRHPKNYITENAYVSVLSLGNKPVSTIILIKDHYYGWDSYQPEIKDTHGLIGFFTSPEYRGKGYAKKLFSEFVNRFDIKSFTAAGRALPIVKNNPSINIVELRGY